MFVEEAFLLKAETDNRTDQKCSIAKKELCVHMVYGVAHSLADAKGIDFIFSVLFLGLIWALRKADIDI